MSLPLQAGHLSASLNTNAMPGVIGCDVTENYTVRGAYSISLGRRLPDEVHTRKLLGVAPVVRRQMASFPKRVAHYFDLTQWGAGYLRVVTMPGGAVLPGGLLLDMQTGKVWLDSRFADDDSAGNVATSGT